ncbi:bromodomain-containing protein 8-like isoform X2 [Diadema setosum]|uniref:bromodomain-containing protein 8-like isoform X2 n=1 Tax=Diadema setosum TaxID=31175 RepID=UPI003B3AADCA
MATTASLEQWTTREKLCLASSVMRSGDQNWVSVSRAIKPLIDPSRPSDWFSQKNCAIQYSAMLEAVDTPKRKRSGEKGEVETPVDLLVRKMTQERIEELQQQISEERKRFKQLQEEIRAIQSGQMDDQLPAIWEGIQQKKKEEQEAAEARKLAAETKATVAVTAKPKPALQAPNKRRPPIRPPKVPAKQQATPTASEAEESLAESEAIISVESPEPVGIATNDAEADVGPREGEQSQPALLSSLLTSQEEKAKGAGKGDVQSKEAVTIEEFTHIFTDSTKATPTKESAANEKHKTGAAVTKVKESGTAQDKDKADVELEDAILDDREEAIAEAEEGVEEGVEKMESVETGETPEGEAQKASGDRTDSEIASKLESEVEARKGESGGGKLLRTPNEPADIDPGSPSVPAKSEKKRGRGRPSNASRKSMRAKAVKQDDDEDMEVKLHGDDSLMSLDDLKDETRSDAADSEDHDRPSESDDTSVANLSLPTSMFSDSVPNSPSSMPHSEEDHAYRLWRKAIMLVWRAAASHKYASVFLHPVTDDIAPGYCSIVHQPMDLSSIKKKIENGTIRTTEAFHRNILLMFQNAIMYNSSDHDVYNMAVSMQNDVISNIEEFISTQLMVQQPDASKMLRGRDAMARRSEVTTKEEEGKARRSSTDHQETSGKKRRTRGDEY